MKKVTILDKSTLSRHFSNDETENSPLKNILEDRFKPLNASATSTLPQESAVSPTTCYNPHLLARSATTKPAQPTSLVVLPNSEVETRRHMYSKAADRSAAIDERIERMARKWTSLPSSPVSYDDLSHPTRASQVQYTL